MDEEMRLSEVKDLSKATLTSPGAKGNLWIILCWVTHCCDVCTAPASFGRRLVVGHNHGISVGP